MVKGAIHCAGHLWVNIMSAKNSIVRYAELFLLFYAVPGFLSDDSHILGMHHPPLERCALRPYRLPVASLAGAIPVDGVHIHTGSGDPVGLYLLRASFKILGLSGCQANRMGYGDGPLSIFTGAAPGTAVSLFLLPSLP